MKMKYTRIVALILLAALLFCGCSERFDGSDNMPNKAAMNESTGEVSETPQEASPAPTQSEEQTDEPKADEKQSLAMGSGKSLHQYEMDLELDEQGKMLSGKMTVNYNNQTGKTLNSIPFHLYPNAYAKEDTAPFQADEMKQAYPNGFSEGGVEIKAVTVAGEKADYTIKNDDSTILDIAYKKGIENDKTAEIYIEFSVKLPNSLGRFGYGENAFNLCNFYPIACAFDGQDFYQYPYYNQGDPFVSDVSDYAVTLRVPEGMLVAHTGSGKDKTKDGVTTYTIEAPMVRDFAAVASREFEVAKKKVNGVNVKSYYYKSDQSAGRSGMQYGANAIKAFSDAFGEYPYDEYCVVQTDFFIGGMEYPGIVLIDESLYAESMSLEYVVVHETAHQWWYGVVGNDQVKEPWLDEALAEYSSILYYGETYDTETEQSMYSIMVEYQYEVYNELYKTDAKHSVGKPITDFDDSMYYSFCVYINGNRMFAALEGEISRDEMKKALSTYYAENQFKRSTKDTLIGTFNKSTGKDWTSFFKKWL